MHAYNAGFPVASTVDSLRPYDSLKIYMSIHFSIFFFCFLFFAVNSSCF